MTKKQKIKTIDKVADSILQALEDLGKLDLEDRGYRLQWAVEHSLALANGSTSTLREWLSEEKETKKTKKG